MIALLYSPLFALQKRENNSNHGCCYSPFFANCKARDTKKVNKSFVPTTIIAQKKKGYVSLARDHGKGRDTTYVINFFIKKKKSWLYNYCASLLFLICISCKGRDTTCTLQIKNK